MSSTGPNLATIQIRTTSPDSSVRGTYFPQASANTIGVLQYVAGGDEVSAELLGRLRSTDSWISLYTFADAAASGIVCVQILPYMTFVAQGADPTLTSATLLL